jgi:hypothetical protein
MLHLSSRHAFVAGLAVAAPLLIAGCGSSSGGSAATTPPPTVSNTTASTPSSDSGSTSAASATFDGAFKGALTMNLCTSATLGSVKATIDGDSASNYLGSVSATELNFSGPKGGIYSTKPGTAIKVSSGTFDVDGLVLTDDVITHQSVTVHGTLTCP